MKTIFPAIIILLFSLTVSLTVSSAYSSEQNELTFVVHPYKPAIELHQIFKPLLKDIETQLGYKIKLKTGKSYNEVIEHYQDGVADFGFLGPAGYVKAADLADIIPLVRIMTNGKGSFQGVIVVKKNSKINSLKDLRGKSFAFGDPDSTLSYFVPRHMLIDENITLKDLSKYAFTGKHDNVARGVLLGTFDAGGLKPAAAEQYLNQGLRILATSEPISEHLFVANKQLDHVTREKITEALLNAELSTLKAIQNNITGLETAKYSDYENLREIISHVEKQNLIERAIQSEK